MDWSIQILRGRLAGRLSCSCVGVSRRCIARYDGYSLAEYFVCQCNKFEILTTVYGKPAQVQSAVCEVLDYICRRDMRYVTKDESYASVLGRLQGDKSGLIRVHI